MKDKRNWGTVVRPTRKAVKNGVFKDQTSYGISLGISHLDPFQLRIVRENRVAVEKYHVDFWETFE